MERGASFPRLPVGDGLVDLGKDELVDYIVMEEAGKERDPGLEEVDGGGRFLGRPVVAEGGKRVERLVLRRTRLEEERKGLT